MPKKKPELFQFGIKNGMMTFGISTDPEAESKIRNPKHAYVKSYGKKSIEDIIKNPLPESVKKKLK